jgi:hypothetical protein
MKFRLYREFGSLNSADVFNSIQKGLEYLGHEISTIDGIPIIWSVLWYGRMQGNRRIYENCIKKKLPIIIVEVGNLKRNYTWRISINHVNRQGIFGNDTDLDNSRPQKLGVSLNDIRPNRKSEILIAAQHTRSLQWQGRPDTKIWVTELIKKLKNFTDRSIFVRPHPRSLFGPVFGTTMIYPKKIENTYDDFDMDYNYHCIINHNSGPAIQSIINGTPAICDQTSLAYPVSCSIDQIENPVIPDRHQWFLELCHTEWTVEEIEKGLPFSRIIPLIKL